MKEIVLPKIISIGIYNAQLVIKNRTTSRNRKTTMFEIELPMEKGGISYIDDTSHLISENVVICAKPGQIRQSTSSNFSRNESESRFAVLLFFILLLLCLLIGVTFPRN